MADCPSCCRKDDSTCDIRDALERSLKELTDSRDQLKTEKDRLCKLAVTTFSLLGEARLTEDGMKLSFFGDIAPEEKLGLASGIDFSDMAKVFAQMHPDDVEPYRQLLDHSVATGEPFRIVYRLSDGRGGWRWLKARAYSIKEQNGKHVHWLHDTVDITEQKQAEEELKTAVDELQRLKTRLQRENQYLKEESERVETDCDIIGASEVITRLLRQIDLVAATSSTVLISGETGTGKDLVARTIHKRSVWNKGLFAAVNCAALPASLVESELFGHEKGAFTGATSRRIGRFEQAEHGTLFLDEVGELPLETQAKMLRVLQTGEFERVGSNTPHHVDVRVIAASNRDLEQAVREGRFRSDLYHRLAVFPIHVQPLRERAEDIPLLTAYLVSRKALKLGHRIDEIPPEVMSQLCAYSWPGNIRELENVIERAIILSPGNVLSLQAVNLTSSPVPKSHTDHYRTAEACGIDAPEGTLRARELAHILRVCESTAWKIKGPDGAAHILGIKPGTLYSRMKKLGLRRP